MILEPSHGFHVSLAINKVFVCFWYLGMLQSKPRRKSPIFFYKTSK